MQMGYGIRRIWFAWLRDMQFFYFFISIYPFKELLTAILHLFDFASEKVEHGYYGVTPFRYTSTFHFITEHLQVCFLP